MFFYSLLFSLILFCMVSIAMFKFTNSSAMSKPILILSSVFFISDVVFSTFEVQSDSFILFHIFI